MSVLPGILAIGRRGTGGPLTPLRLELMRSPAHREILEEHFGCRVHFRAANNDLIFRKSDLDRPFVTHNAELLAMLAPQLEAALADQRLRQTVQDQVKQTLKRLLAGQRPTIQEVAQELNLSARTLQRRLTEGGVTFQQVLEEARRELARHYLLQSSLELNETAYLLGYESANSFFRAFHHWEGTSPGQWRAVQRCANGKSLVSQVPQIYSWKGRGNSRSQKLQEFRSCRMGRRLSGLRRVIHTLPCDKEFDSASSRFDRTYSRP